MATVRKALEAEAKSTSVTFTYKTVKLTIPTAIEADADVMAFGEANKPVLFAQAMLGDAQYAKVRAAGVKSYGDVCKLAEAILDAMGSSLGE